MATLRNATNLLAAIEQGTQAEEHENNLEKELIRLKRLKYNKKPKEIKNKKGKKK